jgi:Skp family chaperone for outer membrane proteins
MRVGAVLLALLLAGPVWGQNLPLSAPLAQADPILTIDQDRLFAESVYGKATLGKLEADQAGLLAENRKIETALEEEERGLTERRKTLPAEEFRALAAAFDTRVEGIRAAQVEKDRSLRQASEENQRRFYAAAFPVIGQLMQDMGASVVLDKRSVVLSSRRIDVTDTAIARIDAAIGDGSKLPEAPPAPQP